MGFSRGANIIRDGLVFGYDADDRSSRFYKGEPTTNMVTYSEYQNLPDNYTTTLGGWDTYEGSMLIDTINKVDGYTNRSIKLMCVQANVYKLHFSATLINGQTYTVSFWAKALIAGNYGNFLLADGPDGYLTFEPGSYSSLTTEFRRISYTFTVSSSTGTYNFATYLYGDGQVAWLSGFQLENKNHATQYFPSNGGPATRSSSQSLIDLKKTATIDLSNVSFDSTAHPIFDGTDDYISIPTYPAIEIVDDLSVELIYMRLTTDPVIDVIAQKYANGWEFLHSTSGNIGFCGRNGDGTYYPNYTSSVVPNNKYHHLVGIKSGLFWKIYVNGQLENSITANSIGTMVTSNPLVIGREGTSYYPNMKLPVFKIYNKALSEAEAVQNYSAYKNRFNL